MVRPSFAILRVLCGLAGCGKTGQPPSAVIDGDPNPPLPLDAWKTIQQEVVLGRGP